MRARPKQRTHQSRLGASIEYEQPPRRPWTSAPCPRLEKGWHGSHMKISAISCLIHDRFGRCLREGSSILDIGRIADSTIFLQEAFCKTSNFGSVEPFVRAATRGVGVHERKRYKPTKRGERWSSGSSAPCSQSSATAWARACPKSRQSGSGQLACSSSTRSVAPRSTPPGFSSDPAGSA